MPTMTTSPRSFRPSRPCTCEWVRPTTPRRSGAGPCARTRGGRMSMTSRSSRVDALIHHLADWCSPTDRSILIAEPPPPAPNPSPNEYPSTRHRLADRYAAAGRHGRRGTFEPGDRWLVRGGRNGVLARRRRDLRAAREGGDEAERRDRRPRGGRDLRVPRNPRVVPARRRTSVAAGAGDTELRPDRRDRRIP